MSELIITSKKGPISATPPIKPSPPKKPYNPWAGKTIEEIRAMEYARNPKFKPSVAPKAATSTSSTAPSTETVKANAKVLAYLKEYVGQMRAAGFKDYNIREKLLKTGSVYIPDQLPANFGQTGPWATGMADEFRFAAMKSGQNKQGLLEDWVPSPNEYMNYMPGSSANRLPSYGEYSGQDTSPFMSPSGKFSQVKLNNLRNTLQENVAGYKGPKIGASQYTLEAGIAGLPQELGQQFYQEFLTLAQSKADEAKKQAGYEELSMKYPEIDFDPEATVQENAKKISDYNKTVDNQKAEQDVYKNELDIISKAGQNLNDDWLKSNQSGDVLFQPVVEKNSAGANVEVDPMERIIDAIRKGTPIEEIATWIYTNSVPINNYQLQGLYLIYGQ